MAHFDTLLGSTLLADEEKQESLRPAAASCGDEIIDRSTLHGGFRYGDITSIAGASRSGKTLFALHAMASHLIAHDQGKVALIATTDPSLVRLKDILIDRLEQHEKGPEYRESGYVYTRQSVSVKASPDSLKRVSSMLERVRLSRVFDLSGVSEAVAEFNTTLEQDCHRVEGDMNMKEQSKGQGIPDSEDELEKIMSPENVEKLHDDMSEDESNSRSYNSLPACMIVVDNIANVVGSIIMKSQVQGHALLADFMRSLHLLTKRRQSCTLLLNSVVGLRPHVAHHPGRSNDQVSAFASILGKPALGKHFAYLIDTSIFLSTLPRSKADAQVTDGGTKGGKEAIQVAIVEVLKDRHGVREGRWSAFVTGTGNSLQSLFA